MVERSNLETLFTKHDCTDFRWIEIDKIVVSHWVRMKCTFGCEGYGTRVTCPPNLPAVSECQHFFREYEHATIFHFNKAMEKPEDRSAWTRSINQNLQKLERDVFLKGHQKAFMLFVAPCNLCDDCSDKKTECNNPGWSRPSLEGMAIDVFSTARNVGFPIEVLTDYNQEMNRYGLLLIE
jgi:predicted metal-binding protein